MSVDYWYEAREQIIIDDLFDGRMEKYGVREDGDNNTSENCRTLRDDYGSLEVYCFNGIAGLLTPYGDPHDILDAISAEFGIKIYIFTEDMLQLGSREAYYAYRIREFREKKEFYSKLLDHLSGVPVQFENPCNIERASIAEDLVAGDFDLLAPKNKKRLLRKINKIYRERITNIKKIAPCGPLFK